MKKYAYLYTNKYLIASLIFMVWLLFFDRNDLFSQLTYRKELKKIQAEKEYYLSEIDGNKKDMKELMSDPEHLEKYAREHYLMKKEDEDIFLVLPDSASTVVEYKE